MVRRIKQFFDRQNFKRKIIIIFAPLSVVPLIIMGALSVYVYSDTIIERTKQNMMDNTLLVEQSINGLVSSTETCSKILVLDLNEYFEEHRSDLNMPEITNNQNIHKILYDKTLLFPFVEDIYYINEAGYIYSTNSSLHLTLYDGLWAPFKEFVDSGAVRKWFGIGGSLDQGDTQSRYISLVMNILDTNSGKSLGTIVIQINKDEVSSIYSQANDKDNDKIIYHLLDKHLNYFSETTVRAHHHEMIDRNILEQTQNHMTLLKKNYLFSLNSINKELEWLLIGESDLFDIITDAKITLLMILLTTTAGVFIIIVSSKFVVRYITWPMEAMEAGMLKLGMGDFDVNFEVETEDEVGAFAKGFNQMAVKISELLSQIKKEQKMKHRYELAVLQNQIKPHFLYNTLDQIYVLSAMNKNDMAMKVSMKLAQFYRLSLSNGRDIVTLDEELTIVKHYLEIQKIRYRGKITYEVNTKDVPIESIMIPKLTLQPIVENSIYHGILENNSDSLLSISCTLIKDFLHIVIKDNGIGIRSDMIDKIFKEDDASHFGLKSIRERLNLFYGDKSNLGIVSKDHEGTVVTLIIPLKDMKESEFND